jgi:hypothetical protein
MAASAAEAHLIIDLAAKRNLISIGENLENSATGCHCAPTDGRSGSGYLGTDHLRHKNKCANDT